MNQKQQEKMSGSSLEKLGASSHLGKGEADTHVPLLTFQLLGLEYPELLLVYGPTELKGYIV